MTPRAEPDTRTIPLRGGRPVTTTVGVAAAIVIDAVAFHLFFMSRSQLVAWSFTALNAWFLFWLWREHKAAAHPTLTIDTRGFEIRLSRRIRIRVPRMLIETVEPATWRSVPDVPTEFLKASGDLSPNVLIGLKEPVRVRFPMGIQRKVRRIALSVDAPDALIAELRIGQPVNPSYIAPASG